MLPTDVAFHRHTFRIKFVYLNFFPAKGAMDLNIVFFLPQKRSPPKVS